MRTLAIATRTAALTAGAGALLFTGVAAQGTAVAAPQGKPAKLTVKDYRAWLKTKDAKTLKVFDKLPRSKQQKLVGYLQNRAVTKEFNAKVTGALAKGGHSEVAYNRDVRFVGDVKTSDSDHSHGVHTITVNFTATERIYDIPVLTQKTTLSYVYESFRPQPRITGKPKLKRSIANLNAAFAIEASKGTVTVKNKKTVVANLTWYATPKYKSAGSGALAKRQTITGSHGATDKFTAVLTKS